MTPGNETCTTILLDPFPLRFRSWIFLFCVAKEPIFEAWRGILVRHWIQGRFFRLFAVNALAIIPYRKLLLWTNWTAFFLKKVDKFLLLKIILLS